MCLAYAVVAISSGIVEYYTQLENQTNLLAIVEASVFILSGQKRYLEAHRAIQRGLAASDCMDCYIADTLHALADRLPKNGF
jgi:hypothetical protein